MSKHRKPQVQNRFNYMPAAELMRMASGRWLAILRDAGIPSDALDARRGRPCPRCRGVDRFALLPDFAERGAVLCRHCFNGETEPRCGDGIATLRWWLGVDAAGALQWLASWLGVDDGEFCPSVRPIERRVEIPEPKYGQALFALMAEVWRRNMRPAWLCRAAELLGLPTDPLVQLCIGWSPEHRATSWPMRNAAGDVIGVRLRCPVTAKKWAVRGSAAGLFYPIELLRIERPERLMVCEGPTDTAALLSIGLQSVGVPSAGGSRDLLVAFSRQVAPAEIVIVADADGPGIDGAERLADAVMAVAPVRIVSVGYGAKDARTWVLAGADRSCIDATVNGVDVRSIALEGVNHE
ncbi:MAG: hypothetical protein R3C09_28540 [Pirellulaceae bacterium]